MFSPNFERPTMLIKNGDALPDVTFKIMSEGGPMEKSTADLFRGCTALLLGMPGALTPTCHGSHLPSYIARCSSFQKKGVDKIMVTCVNDVHVMGAWADATGGKGKIEFLADENAAFAIATGLTYDMSHKGMG